MKVSYELFNSILHHNELTKTETWIDACRKVYELTYTILEGNRLETLRKLIDFEKELSLWLFEIREENPNLYASLLKDLKTYRTLASFASKLQPKEDSPTLLDVCEDDSLPLNASDLRQNASPVQGALYFNE